ncbi:helix-turn-helix domain-containing protein [Phytohabitans rumicis]|uniref:helix-turn-helix domain-containing protein n=1 Tax=Phytohabitans rumicis TaxID=1076125 RepID=UPI001FE7DE5F|nr:helix-turn-helix domain-containing protein [Phytohabitans rumicis]
MSDPVLGRAVSALHAALVGSGAGAVWTEERSDEGRRRLPGAGARASGASANWQSPATALARDERLAAAVAAMSSYAGPVAARPPRGKQAARRVRDMIDEGYARDLTADDLAAAAGTSRYAVYRAFREAYGLSPSDYQRQLRLRSARRMLVAGHGIAESAALAGFADQSHLTRWFLRCYGVTPGRTARPLTPQIGQSDTRYAATRRDRLCHGLLVAIVKPVPETTAARPGRIRVGLRALRDWRPTLRRLRSLVRNAVTSFIVLAGTFWLLPGVTASGLVALLGLVVLVAGVGALLRPLLMALATMLGGFGALVLGALVQAIVLYVALWFAPDTEVANLPVVFGASWVAVALAALVNWFADAGTDDTFISETIRLMARVRRIEERGGRGQNVPCPDGLLVVQLDGVPAPLLRWAVRAGNLPNIGRWLRTRSHRLGAWHTGLPATTPAAQAGILYGDTRRVPAFRWYEKDTRRLLVTSRPRDAAEVERRLAGDRGLLRDGGVSISNVFSGDAESCLLTVSHAALPGRSARGYAAFMTSPYGFTRAVVLGIGELIRELHQARVQRRRDVRPRVSRGGAFLALRPATTLLRDLNVTLIAEQMARGAPIIYCDFVDYDEVAHHAGPARPEALDALESLDQTLGILERLSKEAARRYHLVVLSDHGQSQGATFRQRFDESLEEVVGKLVRGGAENGHRHGAATGTVEEWGRVNALLTEAVRRQGPTAAATRAAIRKHTTDGEVTLGPADEEAKAIAEGDPETVVIASGNLGMVYLTRAPEKLTRDRIDAAYPDLVDGLVAHPGIGIVVVDEDGGPVALGRRGRHRLCDGHVEGEDPLAPYGPLAAADLLRHQQMDHVGDLVLLSMVEPGTDEVAAFEELVGSHGGLGGWQTEAVLLYPSGWTPAPDPLIGPDAVHATLVEWLVQLGLRKRDDERVTLPVAG